MKKDFSGMTFQQKSMWRSMFNQMRWALCRRNKLELPTSDIDHIAFEYAEKGIPV